MLEVVGDLWGYYDSGNWICITTNGDIKKNGEAVMGAGCAREARDRLPEFVPKALGESIVNFGNKPVSFRDYRIITFPTKNSWKDNSYIELIEKSAIEVRRLWLDRFMIAICNDTGKLYIPRPGCGLGGLNWYKDVRPVLRDIFKEDEFIIVSRGDLS